MILRVAAIIASILAGHGAACAADIRAAVLRIDYTKLAPISRFAREPEDLGFAGAALATEDNMTTGAFLGHSFDTQTIAVTPDTAAAELDRLLADGVQIFVVLARDDDFLALADQVGGDGLVFNAGARQTRLRDADCRANTIHVTPSHAMLADAIGQFSIWKKWSRWFLVHGSNPDDLLLADAYRKAATKFGARIVEEREFEDTGGSRRTDSGHVLVQKQLPVFMQEADDHQVVIAADDSDVFAPYLPYHLWDPHPVLGSGGLRPVSFHAAHEAWGSTQFQTRFEALTGRYVMEPDYDTWLALRVLGEAVTRTNEADIAVLRDYILSDDFELAAFKGVPVTVRPWNGQLRAPILLFDGRITVSVSPQDGFLHQVSPLDTLGLDRPESRCTAFE